MDEPFDKSLLEKLKEFPCAFNLIDTDKIKPGRIKKMRHNIQSELAIGDDLQDELIRKKNLLTWVLYRLGELEEAVELSNEIDALTKKRNISALGNRAYVTQERGDVLEAETCVGILEAIKCEKDFTNLLIEAKSEQAYYYSRLGGPQNLSLAISLFSEAVAHSPNNYLWKYGLGLCYRRAIHVNLYCSSPKKIDVEKYREEAIKLLLHVGDNDKTKLQVMAYAELIQVRQHLPRNSYHDNLFRDLSVENLCEKALERGSTFPSVLKWCGIALRSSKVDKSIELLEKSAGIKQSTVTMHHLGKSYARKAEIMSSGFSRARRQQFSDSKSPCKGHATSDKHSSGVTFPIESNQQSLSSTGWRESEFSLSQETRPESRKSSQGASSLPQNTCPGSGDSNLGAMGINRQHNKSSLFHGTEISESKCDTEQLSELYESINSPSARSQIRGAFSERRGRNSGPSSNKIFIKSVSYADMNKWYEAPLSSTTQLENTQSRNSRCFTESRDQRGRYPSVYTRSLSEGWSSKEEVKKFVKQAETDFAVKLNKNDENVQKAINSFKRAIGIANDNFPAVFDLGMILKETNQIKEALVEFNRVAMHGFSPTGHILTIISAHEQAGLCYLKLGKEEEGKEMLLKAVSLAANLAATMPELKESHKDIWTAFIMLINDVDRKPPSLDKEKQKIKLFKMINANEEIAEVIRELLEKYTFVELQDQEIVMATLDNFLSLRRPEDALTFQTLIGISQAGDSNSWWNNEAMIALKTKVMLQASYRRLKENKGNPIFLFQQLFELSYGACVGMRINEEEETGTNETIVGDVLVVFDEDQGSLEEGPSETMRIASCFKEVAACLFGLEAHENLKGTAEYGFVSEIFLNQMRKYQTVVVVVGDEPRDSMFKAILEQIPVNTQHTELANQKILVLNASHREDPVPRCLKLYGCLKLADIGGLGDINKKGQNEDGRYPYTDLLEQVFYKNVDAILKLFCFLTGRSWPCP